MSREDEAPSSGADPGTPELDALADELRGLREVAPPASLVARVMTRVATPQPFSLWRWLRRPIQFEVRLSALSVLTVGLVLTVGATVLVRGSRSSHVSPAADGDQISAAVARAHDGEEARGEPDVGARGDHGEPVLVRFVFEAHGARRVAVAGSFTAWKEQVLTLEDGGTDEPSAGVFVTTLAVPRGTHEYMFVVDGRWIADPLATERRPDGFGRQNSLLRL